MLICVTLLSFLVFFNSSDRVETVVKLNCIKYFLRGKLLIFKIYDGLHKCLLFLFLSNTDNSNDINLI